MVFHRGSGTSTVCLCSEGTALLLAKHHGLLPNVIVVSFDKFLWTDALVILGSSVFLAQLELGSSANRFM